ncbi:PREDICTED: alpha/beta-gliadin A-IV [Drosophila arizonae]|uniref:Alpha/beta-gliadin A-IV n=1 Tax=Drosophila arizonae TaxID=7263 RepID=A0ABM1P1U4_DROAR|nr:PREDICTED: alpha/beta-gliadin A-IV [Drosophila arizonae]
MELLTNTNLPTALLALLQLLLLLPSAQPQHYFPHRQLHYYDAPPRLRRVEYVAAPFVGGYVAPPAAHYQQQTPNFQLLNYRPSYQPLALEYQQQQLPAPQPAAALPALYPQPSVQYLQRSAAPPAELAKYRYEGNYMPVQQRVAVAPVPQRQPQAQPQPQQRLEEQLYNVPPVLFTSDVLHVVPSRAANALQQQQQQQQHLQQQQQQQLGAQRSRRFASRQDADAMAAESRMDSERPTKETKYFHDIFMRFDGPNARSHGHVLDHPKARERRFESQRGTNRYKGEVIWTDRRGAHGEHRWDMAQGKL